MITSRRGQQLRIAKLLSRFEGGTATTRAWAEIPEDVAASLASEAALATDELPLMASLRGGEGWYLLTTARLVWRWDGRLQALPWEEIRGVDAPPVILARIVRQEMQKDEVTELEIFDVDDQKRVLSLEPGATYYLVWNAIIALCNRTRRSHPIDLTLR